MVEVDYDQLLGSGSEGQVFFGWLLSTGEPVAVKFGERRGLTVEVMRRDRLRSARVAAIRAYDLDNDPPYLALEFAEYGSLHDEMVALGSYRPVQALSRTREMLLCLHDIHRAGVIHRDVKPSNVLRFRDGLKLADFGIGRTLDRPCALQTRAFLGTREYAAPEQLRGDCTDHRADLYALGVILYQMLTGSVPDALRDPPVPSVFRGNVTRALDRFVAWLLSREPAHRPRNAAEAIVEVDRLLHGYRISARLCTRLGIPSPY